jgi:hypothetical protein
VEAGIVDAADHERELSGCTGVATRALGCDDAVSVSASYDDCLSDIGELSCATVVEALEQELTPELPRTCSGVIQVSD